MQALFADGGCLHEYQQNVASLILRDTIALHGDDQHAEEELSLWEAMNMTVLSKYRHVRPGSQWHKIFAYADNAQRIDIHMAETVHVRHLHPVNVSCVSLLHFANLVHLRVVGSTNGNSEWYGTCRVPMHKVVVRVICLGQREGMGDVLPVATMLHHHPACTWRFFITLTAYAVLQGVQSWSGRGRDLAVATGCYSCIMSFCRCAMGSCSSRLFLCQYSVVHSLFAGGDGDDLGHLQEMQQHQSCYNTHTDTR